LSGTFYRPDAVCDCVTVPTVCFHVVVVQLSTKQHTDYTQSVTKSVLLKLSADAKIIHLTTKPKFHKVWICILSLIQVFVVIEYTHTHNRFAALFLGPLTEADTLTIWLGTTPSGITSAHLHHPPYFYRPDALPAAQPTALKH